MASAFPAGKGREFFFQRRSKHCEVWMNGHCHHKRRFLDLVSDKLTNSACSFNQDAMNPNSSMTVDTVVAMRAEVQSV